MTWVVVSSLIDTVFHFADGGRKTALCPGGKRSGQYMFPGYGVSTDGIRPRAFFLKNLTIEKKFDIIYM